MQKVPDLVAWHASGIVISTVNGAQSVARRGRSVCRASPAERTAGWPVSLGVTTEPRRASRAKGHHQEEKHA